MAFWYSSARLDGQIKSHKIVPDVRAVVKWRLACICHSFCAFSSSITTLTQACVSLLQAPFIVRSVGPCEPSQSLTKTVRCEYVICRLGAVPLRALSSTVFRPILTVTVGCCRREGCRQISGSTYMLRISFQPTSVQRRVCVKYI